MQERFEKMKELCKLKQEGEYLCSNRLGNRNENYNVYYSFTLNDTNIDVFNEIIQYTANADNFNWFIQELKKDANSLYHQNLKASEEHKDKNVSSYKMWQKRQGCNKYTGIESRKDIENILSTSINEKTVCEIKLYENYSKKPHPVIGYSKKIQVPIIRELGRKRVIEMVFKNNNIFYICKFRNGEKNILRCISEILTYYYVIKKHIEEDGDNKYFYKECAGKDYNENVNYSIEPAIICPASYISGINIEPLLTKLHNECDINLKIVILKSDDGILE